MLMLMVWAAGGSNLHVGLLGIAGLALGSRRDCPQSLSDEAPDGVHVPRE
jgi:hypothetical protein